MASVLACRCINLFFFNDTATTEIYTLSLHDALPISSQADDRVEYGADGVGEGLTVGHRARDRKSTRLNSSHSQISYAVFCLKKTKYSESPSWSCWKCIWSRLCSSSPLWFCFTSRSLL